MAEANFPQGNAGQKEKVAPPAKLERQDRLAKQKLEELIKEYNLNPDTELGPVVERRKKYHVNEKLTSAQRVEVLIGEEEEIPIPIREHTDVVLHLDKIDDFSRMVQGEDIEDLYSLVVSGPGSRVAGNFTYWFVTGSSDGSVTGKVRVQVRASMQTEGFFKEVVFPSFLKQRDLTPATVSDFNKVDKEKGLNHRDPVNQAPATWIRLDEGFTEKFFGAPKAINTT